MGNCEGAVARCTTALALPWVHRYGGTGMAALRASAGAAWLLTRLARDPRRSVPEARGFDYVVVTVVLILGENMGASFLVPCSLPGCPRLRPLLVLLNRCVRGAVGTWRRLPARLQHEGFAKLRPRSPCYKPIPPSLPDQLDRRNCFWPVLSRGVQPVPGPFPAASSHSLRCTQGDVCLRFAFPGFLRFQFGSPS